VLSSNGGVPGTPGFSEPTGPSRRARLAGARLARTAILVLAVLVAAGVGVGAWFHARVHASLPVLDGEVPIAGLRTSVKVERNALGVPTIRGTSRLDVARALGFLHGQDRFFQMDLTRRRAAGELSELVGKAALGWDRTIRVHRFRSVARTVLARATPAARDLLQAYTGGVNAGLAALKDKPFEYIVLGVAPSPWLPEDAVLVLLSMFIELNDWDGHYESTLGLLQDLLPAQMFGFLAPWGTEWDAPLAGGPIATLPVPGPEVLDLRRAPRAAALTIEPDLAEDEATTAGSNNWAVAGTRTAHGGAILADDIHLGLSVPNTWYRASLVWPDPERPGHEVRLTGVTLPGTPAVIAGSNTRVAWGFTNTYGDFSDLVVVEVDPADPNLYFAPDGRHRFERSREMIQVKGSASESFDAVSTIWGPVVDKDHTGRPRALRWTAHEPAAVNFNLLRLEDARTLEEALYVANSSGIPPQNFICASSDGRIGWTVAGLIPKRVGFDGRLPESWRDGSRRWDGWLAASEVPRIVDPPSGLLWTANARTVDGEALTGLGDGGYNLGARARQIRDDLQAQVGVDERDMLAIQLDDRAVFLARWRELLLATLAPQAVASDPRRADLKRFVEQWGGRAGVDSVGYRMVRAFRGFVIERTIEPLTEACRKADDRFRYLNLPQLEGPVWRLVTERPPHLLNPTFASWDEHLLAAADATLENFRKLGADLGARTWGERNTASIRHPLFGAIPLAGQWLNMPRDQLPGDSNMPRFQAPSAGASERTVVSPGHEERGIFHMPCGQSGHPLSPFYRVGHQAWVRGEATPFLPGPTVHTLTLIPVSSQGPTGR
jgi:penicillin G amidase